MEDLRECPCCGKPGKLKDGITRTHSGNYRRGWVGCPACGLYIHWAHDPEGAIRKWNRRAAPHQSPAATASPRGSRAAAAGTGE